MKLICDVCGSEDVCMGIQTKWDFDNDCWKNSIDNKYLTLELQNDKLVEIERIGFIGSQENIINMVKSNIDDFEIDFGCGECEEIVNPSYGNLTDENEIFNKLIE